MRREILAVTVFMLSGSALAADLMPVKAPPAPVVVQNTWYIEGLVGVPLTRDYEVTIGGVPARYEPDRGFYGSIAVGRQFHPNWRADIAFTWAHGEKGNVNIVPGPRTGDIDVYGVAANVYYTFAWTHWIKPFVGAGVGFASFKVRNLGLVGGAFVINDSDSSIAGLLHAGLDVPVAANLTLTARYTAAFTEDLSFASVPPGNTATRKSTVDHIIAFGGRYAFR